MKINTERLLEIGIALSKEKDHNRLLEIILKEAMNITNSDAGTLYLCDAGHLYFRIMRNNAMGVYKNCADEIDLPPVPMNRKNVCACAAIDHALINVPDVRESGLYDFSGPIRYDAMTGYHTQSMLVVPMEDNYGDIIGVLQLLNAKSEDGGIVPFDAAYETVIASLASQAAVCVTNMRYVEDMKELFQSFVHVMSTAIDQRTPYNANHTRNMVRYAERFITFINHECEEGRSTHYFNSNRREQFLMSVLLHDVGKLVIPIEIMDKDTRLSTKLPPLERRFDVIFLQNRVAQLSGKITPEESERRGREVQEARSLVERINVCGFVNDEDLAALGHLRDKKFIDVDGTERNWITPEEMYCLQVRKGTLTPEERRVMESHVEITSQLLSEIKFYPEYSEVPHWAEDHHEFINGSGYPKKLQDGQIDFETRLLTIIDIYDALTAQDRPYRHSMPPEKALSVLDDMVCEGKLDGAIVRLFRESRAWEDSPCD